MRSIGAGDICEFVGQDVDLVAPGSLGTVASVFDPPAHYSCGAGCGQRVGLTVREFPTPEGYIGWCVCSWRPVSRKDDFDRALEDIKARAWDLIPARPLQPITA